MNEKIDPVQWQQEQTSGRNAALAAGINPKDLVGSTKVDLDLIPGPAEVGLRARDDRVAGWKYGPYNWREKGKPVQARTYTSAARRHLKKWFEGEDIDPASGVHHLEHAMACCAIRSTPSRAASSADNRPQKWHYVRRAEGRRGHDQGA